MNSLEGIIKDVEKSSLVSDKVIDKVRELIGQEKWQELHDEESDIMTTTGELLITLKGIPDLEEQNEKLKCCANCEKYFADCEMEDMAEKEYLEANAYCKHWKLWETRE